MTDYYVIGAFMEKQGMLEDLQNMGWSDLEVTPSRGLDWLWWDSRRVLEMLRLGGQSRGLSAYQETTSMLDLAWWPRIVMTTIVVMVEIQIINSILGRPLNANSVDGVEDAKRVATEAADLVDLFVKCHLW